MHLLNLYKQKSTADTHKMIEKIKAKLKPKSKSKQQLSLNGKKLRQSILSFPNEYALLAESTFYTTHLPLILQPQEIQTIFNDKLTNLYKNFHTAQSDKKMFQFHLASIMLSLTEQDGLFFIFLKLWIQFCVFQLNKIVKVKEQPHYDKSKDKQIEGLITSFFHKEFFLICYFFHELALLIYEKPIQAYKQFEPKQLFHLIKTTITSVKNCQKIQRIFLKHVKFECHSFSQVQIHENMQQLQKICKLSKIPAPFLQSINLLAEYIREADIEQKLKKSILFIDKLKEEMLQYRLVNKMNKDYVFCTDDVLSSLTFVMWRLGKNLYGACVYVRIVLCCDFEKVEEEALAAILNRFGDNARHSFQTIYSISKIGLLEQQKVNSIL